MRCFDFLRARLTGNNGSVCALMATIIAPAFVLFGLLSPTATMAQPATALAAGSREWEKILPIAQNLKADGEAATTAKRPILIFFNLTNCPYCRGALREAVAPMYRNAEWRAALEFRQVTIDDGRTFINFEGQTVSSGDFARQRKGTFTPTVMVVDGSGQLLGDPIVGISSFDFYGAYVEILAKKAIEEMRTRP